MVEGEWGSWICSEESRKSGRESGEVESVNRSSSRLGGTTLPREDE